MVILNGDSLYIDLFYESTNVDAELLWKGPERGD